MSGAIVRAWFFVSADMMEVPPAFGRLKKNSFTMVISPLVPLALQSNVST
jgi:hypothetical protein